MQNKSGRTKPGGPKDGWGLTNHGLVQSAGFARKMEKEESPKAFLLHFRICLMPYSASTART